MLDWFSDNIPMVSFVSTFLVWLAYEQLKSLDKREWAPWIKTIAGIFWVIVMIVTVPIALYTGFILLIGPAF